MRQVVLSVCVAVASTTLCVPACWHRPQLRHDATTHCDVTTLCAIAGPCVRCVRRVASIAGIRMQSAMEAIVASGVNAIRAIGLGQAICAVIMACIVWCTISLAVKGERSDMVTAEGLIKAEGQVTAESRRTTRRAITAREIVLAAARALSKKEERLTYFIEDKVIPTHGDRAPPGKSRFQFPDVNNLLPLIKDTLSNPKTVTWDIDRNTYCLYFVSPAVIGIVDNGRATKEVKVVITMIGSEFFLKTAFPCCNSKIAGTEVRLEY